MENPHVIETHQVNISILKRGLKGNELKFDFENRSNADMLEDLGETVERAARIVPGGILIFFPSYKLLNDIYLNWR